MGKPVCPVKMPDATVPRKAGDAGTHIPAVWRGFLPSQNA